MNGVYDAVRTAARSWAEAGMLPEAFQYAFVVNALICGLFIGPVLGGVGTMVVTKRLAFFSQAVGHAALTGVAIGITVGEPYTAPYGSMLAFCILVALTMNFTKNRTQIPSDTIIGVFLSISLAVGASVLLYVSAKVNVHILDNILFGSILTVNDTDINVLIVLTALSVAVGLPLYNDMLLASFNPSLAGVRGVRVRLLDYIFVLMITLLTVAAVKIIGAILVEALLLIPAAAARNFSRSVKGFFFLSVLIATVSCFAGIIVPIQMEWPLPSGGAIILAAAVVFAFSAVVRIVLRSFRESAY